MTVNMMITKSKITISNIIEFIHTAMNNNLEVSVSGFITYKYGFDVINNDIQIRFLINEDCIVISTYEQGHLHIDTNLTERDKLDLEALKLDIKEYNEEKAINLFNDFFNYVPKTPVNIDNLDDDD